MTDPMQEHYHSNGQIYTDMIIYTHITEDESYCSVWGGWVEMLTVSLILLYLLISVSFRAETVEI